MAEQIVKLKKKQWFPIIAPKQFDNAVIGETLVYEPSAMLGKTLSHSLMNLTNDTKRQSDVNAILNAVHQYSADNKGAPPTDITTSRL